MTGLDATDHRKTLYCTYSHN